MKQKLYLLIMFMCVLTQYVYAQKQTELKGSVINSETKQPVSGVLVSIVGQNQTETTDSRGQFYFPNVASGNYTLTVSSPIIQTKSVNIKTVSGRSTSIDGIKVIVMAENDNTSAVGVIDESLVDESTDDATQGVSSMVILSNDVYLKKVGYQLSPARFRIRGYDSHYEQRYINGVNFNDQLRGVFNYSAIGALNDVTRNGDVINYMTPGTFSYGTIGGSENINMRASSFAKGGKITLSYTNRNYYLRAMGTYSTGLMDNGWAVTASIGGRYSDEGAIDGTFYSNVSYALSVEKQWDGGKHSLSFVTFGSPVSRGQQAASYQEVYDLVGNNLYNPNWGYQNGKKRNARVVNAYDPTAILSHIWKIDNLTTLTTGLGVHYGKYGSTALNWYNGRDPRPDYYRNLPSYYDAAPEVHDLYTKIWKSKDPAFTQINWDNLYETNRLQPNGAAIYMLEDRRSDLFEATLNSTLNKVLNENINFTAGVGLRSAQSKQFKTVDDLLGSQYVLDVDKFAEQDFPGNSDAIQNDLKNPNKKAKEGDKFGYNFLINMSSANIWAQNQHIGNAVDFYYGIKLGYAGFQRDGKMQNGRYPDNSYGKGRQHDFFEYALKTGLTYKINGRHFLTANASFSSDAPLANAAYVSPRITDRAVNGLENGKIFSADLNYIFSLSSFNGRVSVFQTNFYDQTERFSYYHETERTFVNHTWTGMNKVNRGFELGATYRINNNWSVDLAGTVAEYYYNNNPMGTLSSENGKIDNVQEKIYLKNYYVGSTPQIAGVLGLRYFYNYWFFELNLNGFASNHIDIAPMRRLASNYQNLDPNNPADVEAVKALTHQEKYKDAMTLDFSVGKVLYLKNRNSLNFNLSLSNILNNKDIKTGGYEQGRTDASFPYKFPAKYYYMQGISCFLNASYRF